MPTDDRSDLLGDRLNSEPVIFRGYTDSELALTLRVAAAVYAPPGVLAGFAVGNLGLGLGVAMLLTLATVWFGATLFQRLKRGRPDYHLQQRAHLWLADRGLVRPEFRFRGEAARFRGPDGSCQMSLGRAAAAEPAGH